MENPLPIGWVELSRTRKCACCVRKTKYRWYSGRKYGWVPLCAWCGGNRSVAYVLAILGRSDKRGANDYR